jgi:oxygen-independent coproporphyrinogen III oxidase
MEHSNDASVINASSEELLEIALTINGKEELPTREEFFTNYPFFKYWKTDSNEQLFADDGINIYIHIPFCIQICDYCFYMKELVKSKSQVDDYIDHLCREMQLVSERYNLRSRNVNSVYIGGGTPSVLTEQQFKKLIDALHKNHRVESPEFTFEAEPGTFTRPKLEWYKESGVNRISMGVQSFEDDIIRLSSRKHTSAQAINSIKMIRETGDFTVNIDLLSGLAGESMETWERSVATAMEQEIDMLTIYKMKAYANTVFFKMGVHKNEIRLPSEQEEIAFMKSALKKVRERGYSLWSTFAFTSNDYKHRYAENTWRGQDLIAYGASSFGKVGDVNYQNVNNIDLYGEKLAGGRIPVYRSYSLTSKDKIVKELLLCAARLSSYKKAEFVRKFGFDYFELIPDVIGQLVGKGYIIDNKDELILTEQGILFGDFIGKVLASSVKDALGKDTVGFKY